MSLTRTSSVGPGTPTPGRLYPGGAREASGTAWAKCLGEVRDTPGGLDAGQTGVDGTL